ncbi:helix-turn-helix transcriptional regulator [Rivularia sp. UHCC 0363]|uniref:helix-turn-helix transcriptional regulator n=1 Tax=Rivularia sp. UHCC 0363 TaxID=3110244 RepID=UPI002B1F1F99|nr:LuxR C-terminal-related transcriptional regulator [Rivularia sp. UHCC 0363]MEA5592874.1 LuxR C-terminal-related transcriptional regulator [Rivularia sp. UHCC 0363]
MEITTIIQPETTRDLEKLPFLVEIIENFEDGILLLTETGELVHSNASAYNICSQIEQCHVNQNSILSIIRNLCRSSFKNQIYCDNSNIWSEDIVIAPSTIFRLRVRWLNLELTKQPYLLVTIENRYETLKNSALSEANKYHLTQREAEIWSLYRATSSYKQIANKLYITVNTVKKHIKNIRAKQQRFYLTEIHSGIT